MVNVELLGTLGLFQLTPLFMSREPESGKAKAPALMTKRLGLDIRLQGTDVWSPMS